MADQDLPLDLVVLANFGLAAGHLALGRVRRVEPDGLNALMADAKPSVAIARGDSTLALTFEEPRAFRPESLAQRVPEARALLELRQRVSQRGLEAREMEALIGSLPAGSPLRQALEGAARAPAPAPAKPAAPPPASAPAPTRAPEPKSDSDSGSPLDAIFSMVDAGATAAAPDPEPVQATRALDRLVGLLGATRTGQAGSSTQARLASVIDETLSDTLREVLADSRYQAVEQAWAGLRMLLKRINPRAGVRIHVLPTSRANLVRDAREALARFAEAQHSEARVVVALADFDLAGDDEGLKLAAALAEIAAAARMPLVAEAAPALLGLRSLSELESIENVRETLVEEAHPGWNALRGNPAASWLALTINRFLMRMPYGAEHDRVKGFAFEEGTAEREPAYLWGRGMWIVAERIAASFERSGWGVEITGVDPEVASADLPVRMLRLKTGETAAAPLEVVLSERRALEFLDSGLTALLCRRGGDFAFLAGAPVVRRSVAASARGSEARRDSLPFALFVAQVHAWVANFEAQGRFATEEERREAVARGIQFLSMNSAGPTLEAQVEGESIRVTPWRDPLRGLPDFALTLPRRT